MREAVIVEAVRSAVGKRDGGLKAVHPVDLLGSVLAGLMERSGIDPAVVDDVVAGCVDQVGEQSVNIGRNAWLGAGLPESVPATTVDRQCGSSQQAAHFAAQGVIAGAYDVAVACGVESMTRVPMLSNTIGQNPFGNGMLARYGENLVPQGLSAEMIAAQWGITREDADALALESHRRAAAAADSGAFADEILPIKVTLEDGSVDEFAADEGIRRQTSAEKLAGLAPAFYSHDTARKFPQLPWIVTAGNSSQISDGAAALLVMTPEKAKELRLTPRWRFRTFALAATDPVTMLTGPIPATQKALAKAGLAVEDIDHFEINEAFATVVAAWLRETGADPARVNPRGGAIALGHPLGGSGARLMTTMVHALEQSGGRLGLQSMCEGGGLANATIIERLG
ncbi:MAG: acetyl-CoA C-acyltransferase [Nitriliruptorales bacterium]|nr:acetyl-CoA C-acyltransferase [Nitriliruptorales bacterium]